MQNINARSLKDMTLSEISELPATVLADLQAEISDMEQEIKQLKSQLTLGIDLRYSATAEQARANEGKDTGAVRLDDDGMVVTATLPKRVKWDQAALVSVLESMPIEEARHYAKATYAVDERKFTAAPPHIQEKLSEARTVEVGKPTYKIEAREAA